MITRPFRKTAVFIAAFSALLVLNMQGAAAECEPQIDRALRDKGIAQEDIVSIKTARRPGGAKGANIHRVDAWIKLKSCSAGYLMITLTRMCVVQQVYTRGDCEMGGMPGY